MSAQFLPSIFVPLIGIVFPALFLSYFFSFIEKEKIS